MRRASEAIGTAMGAISAAYLGLHTMIQLLFWAIILDVLSGLAAAFVRAEISSDVSMRGMTKKAIMLLAVAGGEIVDHHTGMTLVLPWGGQLGLGEALAAYYCVHEAISIVENIGRAGVPMPAWIINRLERMKREVEEP